MIVAGRVVHVDGIRSEQIHIEGQQIVAVGSDLGPVDTHVADHCLIFAGMGDIHIHARDDAGETEIDKEDFVTAAQAAIHGGVVHVADMPNNPTPPICDA
ncbi:MAG: amidohydrolase, partial [Planctomycetaceae bacterium]